MPKRGRVSQSYIHILFEFCFNENMCHYRFKEMQIIQQYKWNSAEIIPREIRLPGKLCCWGFKVAIGRKYEKGNYFHNQKEYLNSHTTEICLESHLSEILCRCHLLSANYGPPLHFISLRSFFAKMLLKKNLLSIYWRVSSIECNLVLLLLEHLFY